MPLTVHRLNAAEQRVLASFIAGRLPAGQVDAQLARARAGAPRAQASVALESAPATAVAA
jgi:hypothetical protein